MGTRGRKVVGIHGPFVAPIFENKAALGALHHACAIVLGDEAPGRATLYRYGEPWIASLLHDAECGSLESHHPDWAHFDRRNPDVLRVESVAASARSYAAARHIEGYATRSARLARGLSTDTTATSGPSTAIAFADPGTHRG